METNKIICGNCLEIIKYWPDKCVDLVVTSPPYNLRTRIRNGKYTEREWSKHFSKKYRIFRDSLSPEQYYDFHKEVIFHLCRVSKVVFWNIQIATGNKEAVFKLIGTFYKQIRDVIIWDKGWGQPAMHEGVVNGAAEWLIIFEDDGRAGRAFRTHNFKRGTIQDIWRFGKGKQIEGNSACFNIEIPRKAISNWSNPGDIVLDPMCGSGTTCFAADQLKRKYIGIDISEEYCKLARKRIDVVGEHSKAVDLAEQLSSKDVLI